MAQEAQYLGKESIWYQLHSMCTAAPNPSMSWRCSMGPGAMYLASPSGPPPPNDEMPLLLLEQGAHLQHLRNADERGVRMHPRSHPTALQAGSRCSTKGISKGRATRSSSQASVAKTPSSSAVSPWAAAPRVLLAGGCIPPRRSTAVALTCSIVQDGGRACYAVRQRGRCAIDSPCPLVVLVLQRTSERSRVQALLQQFAENRY